MEIIPAILPNSLTDLEEKCEKVFRAVKMIQVDICDGKYVPNATWPINGAEADRTAEILSEEEGMPYWDTLDFEFDLMIENPAERLPELLKFGPSRLIFHLGSLSKSNPDIEAFLSNYSNILSNSGIEIGIAIKPSEDPAAILSLVEKGIIQFVQFMGIERIGFQGEKFDGRVIEKTKDMRMRFPDFPIAVDGGVTLENAPLLAAAGATRLAVGSTIWQSLNPLETITELQNLK